MERKNDRKPGKVFTAFICEKCGELYEADREHICRLKNSYPIRAQEEIKDKKDRQKAAIMFLECLYTWAETFKDKGPIDRAAWFDYKLLDYIAKEANKVREYIKEGE